METDRWIGTLVPMHFVFVDVAGRSARRWLNCYLGSPSLERASYLGVMGSDESDRELSVHE